MPKGVFMAHFLITFMETLEVALVISIIWGYLSKTKQFNYQPSVIRGVGAGFAAGILVSWLFALITGGLEGHTRALFEGLLMISGAFFYTAVIFWLIRQRNIAAETEGRAEFHITKKQDLELAVLLGLVVMLQVIDTLVLLEISTRTVEGAVFIPALAGLCVAVIAGLLFYQGVMTLSVRKFFSFSTILLILFAAGFVAFGVNELQTAGVIPVVSAQVWDINPAVNADGSYPLFHENGGIGMVLQGLFGYNGDPNFIEIIAYIFYLTGITYAWRVITKKS